MLEGQIRGPDSRARFGSAMPAQDPGRSDSAIRGWLKRMIGFNCVTGMRFPVGSWEVEDERWDKKAKHSNDGTVAMLLEQRMT